MKGQSPTKETFIIRLWKKAPAETDWHGQVQNVRTGQAIVIHNLPDLLSFFENYFPEQNKISSTKTGLK